MSVWGSEEEKKKFAIGAMFGAEYTGILSTNGVCQHGVVATDAHIYDNGIIIALTSSITVSS